MQAVVLVGGLGTRLRPLTADMPKQMLPIVDRPMIEHVVAHLAGHGVTRVVLSLGFRPEAFTDRYPDGTCVGLPLHYAVEPEPLDTAGAVRFAALAAGIGAGNGTGIGSGSGSEGCDTFLVLNGDVLTDLDIGAMVASHRAAGAEATLARTEVDDPSRYGVVPTDAEGRVLGFVEKPDAESASSRWINAGTYVLEPTVLERIEAGCRVSIEREVFPALAVEGSLWAVCSAAYWLDTGTPEDYLRAQVDLIDGTRARMDPVAATAGVAASAVVERAVVMSGASVGSGATVCDAVLMEGAVVEAGAVVRDSVLGPGARVEERAVVTGWTLVGRGQVVGADTVADGVRFPDED